jgi:uncharacterized protein (TIGR02598 family)
MKLAPRHHSAFSLVEVTLALGVAAFALVAIFGLLPVGLNSNQASIEQTTATSLATRISADLRKPVSATAPATGKISKYYQIPIQLAGDVNKTRTVFLRVDGSVAQTATPTVVDQDANMSQNPRYRVTVSLLPGRL